MKNRDTRFFSAYTHAPVAQLDRALGFGPRGWGFESLRVYHFGSVAQLVEQLPLKQTVLGSSPSGPTNMYFVYIVQCADGSFYTGFTTDLEKRINVHNEGKGAKYTRARLPVQLQYAEEYNNQTDARQREYDIKQMSRREKEQLIMSKGV